MIKYLTLFLLLFSFSASAQRMSIQGEVNDTTGHHAVHYAVAMAIKLSDSLLVAHTRTDENGFFKMDSIPVDSYEVIISHPFFGDQKIIVLGSTDNPVIDFRKITLPPKSVLLQEVTIFGYADPVYYNGDTLVYTADSFNVKRNAVVEDLLKKLPGIKVDKEGKIYSQGKAVDQLLVDGDEFFGGDATVATKNLAANSVESVQVYDKKNENASDNGDNETLKVMNLKLKEDARKGYFGKISAASDFSKFHQGDFLLNNFKGKQKISLFGLMSNTPHSSFGWGDINQYGLNNETNNYYEDGMQYTYRNDEPSGIPQTTKTGFYYTDMIGKKIKLSLNYSYNKILSDEKTSTASQYFLTDTSYKTNKFLRSKQRTEGNRANLSVNYPVDSLTEIEWKSNVKYNSKSQSSFESNTFLTNENVLSRITDINNSSHGKDYDWTNTIRINRNFKKRDRKLNISYSYDLINNQSNGDLVSDNTYFGNSPSENDSINQKKSSVSDKDIHNFSVSYTEPLNQKIKSEVTYEYNQNTGTQDKRTSDFINGNYDTENPALTNNFENKRSVNRFGIKFSYEVKKQTLSIGTRARQVNSTSTNLVSQEKISQTVNNILPFLTYRYKFSDNQGLNLRVSTNSNQPDLQQLQPVQDNTNPNYISKGNPDLVPSYTHNVMLIFNSWRPISGRSMWGNIGFNRTDNAFANSTEYDSIGRTISQLVNVNGNYSAYAYLNFNIPFLSKLIVVNPDLHFNYNNSSNYINKVKNTTKESSPGGELDITVQTDKIEFSIAGNYSYSSSSSSLNSQSNRSYYTSGYEAGLSVELPKKFKIETEVGYTKNNDRSQGYNINYLIWNASLNKTFFKNENFIVSLDASDLLNQNISTYRNVEDNVVSDVKTTIIGRYVLLKAIFKFNSSKKKEEGDDDED